MSALKISGGEVEREHVIEIFANPFGERGTITIETSDPVQRAKTLGQLWWQSPNAHIDHLHDLELGEYLAWCDTTGPRAQLGLEGDLQAVGQEGDEDVGLDHIAPIACFIKHC